MKCLADAITIQAMYQKSEHFENGNKVKFLLRNLDKLFELCPTFTDRLLLMYKLHEFRL